MAAAKTGEKGLILEEVLKAYFSRTHHFVVRSVPVKIDGEDLTDIDLWLYERPGGSTRRRIIVDIKSRKSPKAAERVVWTKGLQSAVGVDTAIVATTARGVGIKRLAKNLDIALLDGDAVAKLSKSEELRNGQTITLETLDAAVRAVDKSRRSAEWRTALFEGKASLVTGFGILSANKNLSINAYFAEEAVLAQPNTAVAETAMRLLYLTASLVAVSLDFAIADHAFRSPDERRKVIVDGLRFGQSATLNPIATVEAAIGLARQYADNGNAVAKQIESGFISDADRIPAEIIADYVAKVSARDTLFEVARELDAASFASTLPPYDHLSAVTKSFLGVVWDFNGIARDKIAAVWSGKAKPKEPQKEKSMAASGAGPLFKEPSKPDPI